MIENGQQKRQSGRASQDPGAGHMLRQQRPTGSSHPFDFGSQRWPGATVAGSQGV